MKLTPLDIQRHEFQQRSFRGLDSDEVRTFLNDVSEEMEQLRFEHEKQSEEIRRVNLLLSEHTQREEILKNTLVAAQRTSEELKDNAKKQSHLLLKEAELAADRLVEAASAGSRDRKRRCRAEDAEATGFELDPGRHCESQKLDSADERKRRPAGQAEFPEAQSRTLRRRPESR